MPKFIRKDAQVEASQFTEKQAADKKLWPRGAALTSQRQDGRVVSGVGIPGPDGILVLQPGDWIVKSGDGKDEPVIVTVVSDADFQARHAEK